MIAVALRALHPGAAAHFCGTIAENHRRIPDPLDVIPVSVGHAVTRGEDQLYGKASLLFSNFAEAYQPRGVRYDHVVAIVRQAVINLRWLRLADRGAENAQMPAGQIGHPTADPVSGVKRANHAVAGAHAIFIKRRCLIARRKIDLVISKVNSLGPAGSPRGFEHGLRLPAKEILRRQVADVLRSSEDIS